MDTPDRSARPGRAVIDPDTPWYHTPFFGRLIGVVFPPLGLLLLRTNRNLTRRGRMLAAAGLMLYLIPYTVGVIWLLVALGGVEVEWRGGLGPSLVRRKTAPNYLELETDRAGQEARRAHVSPTAPAPAASWTDFRGPRRDGHYTEQPILTDLPAQGPPGPTDPPLRTSFSF